MMGVLEEEEREKGIEEIFEATMTENILKLIIAPKCRSRKL